MLLKQKSSGHLVDVDNLADLISPFHTQVSAKQNWGEEMGDPESLAKNDLCFLSNEPLPVCWTNEHYRHDEMQNKGKAGIGNYYGA